MEIDRNVRKKIFNSKIFWYIIFFILIKPGSLSENSDWKQVGNIISNLRYIVIVCILLLFLIDKQKIDKFLISYIVFFMTILFSTIYNGGAYLNMLFDFFSIITWIILFQYSVKTNSNSFICSLENIYIVLIFINFITILFFPRRIL